MGEATAHNALEDWISESTTEDESKIRAHVSFPADDMLSLYLQTVGDRPEREVKELLWRMFTATTSKADADTLPLVVRSAQSPPDGFTPYNVLGHGSIKRLLWREKTATGDAWEGMTWTLEFLPYRPGSAITALELYLQAQWGLPDGRIHAIADGIDIIRARWIGSPSSAAERIAMIHGLSPRTFEALVAALWKGMGYAVTLTAASGDGGYDVRAVRDLPGRRQNILIECKLYGRPVGVRLVRGLAGSLKLDSAATQGAVVTSSTFTKQARDYESKVAEIELVSGEKLVLMLNEHLGWDWPTRVGRITSSLLTGGSAARNTGVERTNGPADC
ncbi:MAG TPA: restriction endonuclease [Trebonia sp.]|jgi:restriction system protein|nr:restriction endonuclease [Trebonia sp.]